MKPMTAAEWDTLPEERKLIWVNAGLYAACEQCQHPLPRWMAEAMQCPDCGDTRAVIFLRLPKGVRVP